jgi:hypothetical protein
MNWLNQTHVLKRWQIILLMCCSQVCIWLMAGCIDQDEVEKTFGNIAVVAVAVKVLKSGKTE